VDRASSSGPLTVVAPFAPGLPLDQVFDPRASQEAVYGEVEPLVQSALDGFRVCIFAYGQVTSRSAPCPPNARGPTTPDDGWCVSTFDE
jgi:hypothetical protein